MVKVNPLSSDRGASRFATLGQFAPRSGRGEILALSNYLGYL